MTIISVFIATSTVQTSPFKNFIPSAAQIGFSMKSLIAYSRGNKIKEMAKPFGFNSTYPVLVKDERIGTAKSLMQSNKIDPTLNYNKSVIFDSNFYKHLMQDNPNFLVATLLREDEHLKLEHALKKQTHMKNFIDQQHLESESYLQSLKDQYNSLDNIEHRNIVKQRIEDHTDSFVKNFPLNVNQEKSRISRVFAKEADAAIKHPELCLASYDFYRHQNARLKFFLALERSNLIENTPKSEENNQMLDSVSHIINSLESDDINTHDHLAPMIESTVGKSMMYQPLPGARALYFKEWIQKFGMKKA